jgi:voltage-gated potassium channel
MTATGPAASRASITAPGTLPRPGAAVAVLSVLRTLLVTVLALLVYAQAPWDRSREGSAVVLFLGWLVLLGVALWWQLRAVARSPHPWLRAAQAVVLVLLLLVVPFATAYAHASAQDPATFTQPLTRIDALYFTVTVFATVGFGDIAPVTEAARVLVTLQMVIDLVLIGVIVKVLTGAARHRRDTLRGRAAPTVLMDDALDDDPGVQDER